MDRYFVEEIMKQTLDFCMGAPVNVINQVQLHMLKLYEGLVTNAHTHHSLLVHKPFLIPLLSLLDWYVMAFLFVFISI